MRRGVFASVLLILVFSLSMAAQLPNYTLADVAKHNTSTDCWIILNKTEVYNVTAFLSIHPAGPSPITPYCGADATTAFNNVGHSSSAVAMEATYLIGNLVASTISVSISPTTATVTTGQTQAFTATVTGSTKGVTWSSTSVGTIDQTGLFTAVSAGTGTVTATSVEDTTKSATAQVTVKSSGGGGGGISINISPVNASVSVGGTQQFTANVTGSSAGVTWTATGSVGTVDSNGMFTATKAGMGVVKATSVGDPTKSASANVTVTKTGAACSLTSTSGGFSINCVPASAIPTSTYRCTATSSGTSTVVQCRSGSGGHGGDGGGGHDD
jgi:hypothetical protein